MSGLSFLKTYKLLFDHKMGSDTKFIQNLTFNTMILLMLCACTNYNGRKHRFKFL